MTDQTSQRRRRTLIAFGVFGLLLLGMGTMSVVAAWALPYHSPILSAMTPLNRILVEALQSSPMVLAASTALVVPLLLTWPRALWVRVLGACMLQFLATLPVACYEMMVPMDYFASFLNNGGPPLSLLSTFWYHHGYSCFVFLVGTGLSGFLLTLSPSFRIGRSQPTAQTPAKLSIVQVLEITAIIAVIIRFWTLVDINSLYRDDNTTVKEINLVVSGFAHGCVVALTATVLLGHQRRFFRLAIAFCVATFLAFDWLGRWAERWGYTHEDVWSNATSSLVGSGLIALTQLSLLAGLLLWLRRCGYRMGELPESFSAEYSP